MAAQQSVATLCRPSIVCFGDSITQFAFGEDGEVGWVSLLAASYSRRADVLNRGFSGYNTKNAIDILPSVFGDVAEQAAISEGNELKASSGSVPPNETLFCTVFFGANDAVEPPASQHIPLVEFEQNLRTIIRHIRKCFRPGNRAVALKQTAGASGKQEESLGDKLPIILMTPPPIDAQHWEEHCAAVEKHLNRRSLKAALEYGKVVQKVGKEMDCEVVDTFELLGGNELNGTYKQFLSDGLHLNGRGNTLVHAGLMDMIKKSYPHIAPMEDGDGRNGTTGIPMEEKLWQELSTD